MDFRENVQPKIILVVSTIFLVNLATSLECIPIAFLGHLKALLRSLMIAKMGLSGDTEVIEEAKKRFAAHLDGSGLLPADLRAAVSHIIKLIFILGFEVHILKFQENIWEMLIIIVNFALLQILHNCLLLPL